MIARKYTLSALVANAVAGAIIAAAAALYAFDADLYYLSVQEDEFLEWGTVWAFVFAAAFSFASAVRQYRDGHALPWFLAGVGLFCVFVALEEISWGQRLIGYRPPVYFLDQNFQQEFNLHNVIDTKWRKLALATVILGYGVVLPVLRWMPPIGRLFNKIGVVAPSIGLLPVFLAAYVLYRVYPWSHTGEWVELLLGLGFLFASLADVPTKKLLAITATVLVLGLVTALAQRHLKTGHVGNIEAAESELAALEQDFASGKLLTRCGLHKRLYTYVQQYEQDYLERGAFAALTRQGLPEERAEFLLDPWNSPYWVRMRCPAGARPPVVIIYSFGPNRRRDSSKVEVFEDDIGVRLE